MRSNVERIHAHATRQAALVNKHLNRAAPKKTPSEARAQMIADMRFAQEQAQTHPYPSMPGLAIATGLGSGGI